MGKKKYIIRRLLNFKNKASKDFPIMKMVFFGSRTTDKQHRDSDIDLIIVSQKFRGLNFFKRGARMYDYWDIGYPVDFLCYTPGEFKKLSKQITIVSQALKEGVEI